MQSGSSHSEEIYDATSNLFISQYIANFNRQLCLLSESSKHIIKNNKELGEMYDLFLDFIIDGSQHLDYQHAKNIGKNID
jgi:hypothetical protein